MILRNPRYQIGVLAALVLLGVALWLGSTGTPAPQTTGNPDAKEPDAFIENGRYRMFNATDGVPDYGLTAPRSELWQERDVAEFTGPELLLRQKDGAGLWRIRAESGTYVPGKETLELTQQVQVRRESDTDPALLETERLVFRQADRFIESGAPIKITDSRGETRAQNMTMWIDQRIVELSDHVEGLYDISKRPRP